MPASAESHRIHVRPSPGARGDWLVEAEGGETPLAVHGTATEAERDARRRVASLGGGQVMVRDRYFRVREVRVRRQGG